MISFSPEYGPQPAEYLSVSSLEQLVSIIKKSQLPSAVYTHQDNYLVRKLLKEIEQGESLLVKEAGKIIRLYDHVMVKVCYFDEAGSPWQLREVVQWSVSSRELKWRNLRGVSEKIKKSDSSVHEAAVRSLREELGIHVTSEQVKVQKSEAFSRVSGSYPGLPNRGFSYFFDFKMPSFLYKPHYVEIEDDTITLFGWEQLHS